jgi:xanthine dehydrogenase accessory factor
MTEEETNRDWSVPEAAVMSAIRRTIDDGEPAVLATVVDVEGNAYRRPGAKMVVSEQGAGVGSITAGCLEDDVLALARRVQSDGEIQVERFDLTADDDVWGLGLGCNGVIDVMLEPLDERHLPIVDTYESGGDVAALTVLESEAPAIETGAQLRAPAGDLSSATVVDGAWPDWLLDRLAEPVETLVGNGQSDTIEVTHEGDTVRVFVDAVTAPPRLVVFGTGHDVKPVVELARKTDFRVTVAGFRGGQATEERFPNADRVVATSPAQIRERIDFDEETYAVVMTHNFVDDGIVVGELLETPTPYIGVMGPNERFEEMLPDVESDRGALSDAELDRIYTPIGLDVGGGSPYQIALSVVAEVRAVSDGREPQHLRDRKSPIHERVDLDA